MEKDFIIRLKKHIELVQKYGSILEKELNDKSQFIYDISHHDSSKFSNAEKQGYIYINALYNLNHPYPNKYIEQLAENAWKHHYKNNNHHPEFWQDCNEMPKYVVAHMVADWKSMEKINENSMKINEFWEKIASKKYNWGSKHIKWIKEFIEILK